MSLLGLFGSGGLLDSKDSGGLLGKHFSPNMPLLMTGLGMMGGGWGGALPGLQAGMQHQRQAQGVKDWESVIGGMGGGQGAPQPGMPMPAVPSPMPGIGGPSPATPAATFVGPSPASPAGVKAAAAGRVPDDAARNTYALAIQAGMPPMQAAVWAGNVQQESSFNPGALNKGEGAFGLIQWRESRRRQLEEFARKRGTRPDDPETQARFSLWEMTEGPPEQRRPGQAFLAARTPEEANQALKGYIRYGDDSYQTRLNNARNFLGSGAPAPQAAGGGAVPSPQQQQAFVNSLPPQEVQALARLAAQNPQVASAILQQKFKAQQPKATTDDIQEYSFARQQGYTGSFMDYTASKRQGSTPRLSFQKQGNDIVGIDQQTGQEVSRVPGDAKTQTPPSGYRWTDDGNLEAIAGGPAIKEQRGQKVDDALSLRGKIEGLPSYKKYADSAPIFNSMVTSSASESRAADLDFIYGLAKIMDPESVVREGEMGLVQGTQSMPENMAGWLNSFIMSGQRLSPEARQEILNLSKRRVDQYRANLESDRKSYGQLGADYGITSPNVLPPMVPISPMPPTGSKQEAKPAQTPRIRPQQVPPSMDKSKLPRVTTQQEYDTLQSGAFYVEVSPDGKEEVFKKP